MRDYKNKNGSWTGAERQKSYGYTKRCFDLGLLPKATKCEVCGQEKGILQVHNENYTITLNVAPKLLNGTATEEEVKQINECLKHLCWRCHMIYHSYHRNPRAVINYFARFKNKDGIFDGKTGSPDAPVFRHDYSILRRDYGI